MRTPGYVYPRLHTIIVYISLVLYLGTEKPLVLDGMYATFSSAHPSVWASELVHRQWAIKGGTSTAWKIQGDLRVYKGLGDNDLRSSLERISLGAYYDKIVEAGYNTVAKIGALEEGELRNLAKSAVGEKVALETAAAFFPWVRRIKEQAKSEYIHKDPIVLHGMCVGFSAALESKSGVEYVDAVYDANYELKNKKAMKDNIMLCVRSDGTSFVKQAEQAKEAGAVGVIVVNTDDSLIYMPAESGKSKILDIPVLMIKASDAMRLREHGSAVIRDKGKLGPGAAAGRGCVGLSDHAPCPHLHH